MQASTRHSYVKTSVGNYIPLLHGGEATKIHL